MNPESDLGFLARFVFDKPTWQSFTAAEQAEVGRKLKSEN